MGGMEWMPWSIDSVHHSIMPDAGGAVLLPLLLAVEGRLAQPAPLLVRGVGVHVREQRLRVRSLELCVSWDGWMDGWMQQWSVCCMMIRWMHGCIRRGDQEHPSWKKNYAITHSSTKA